MALTRSLRQANKWRVYVRPLVSLARTEACGGLRSSEIQPNKNRIITPKFQSGNSIACWQTVRCFASEPEKRPANDEINKPSEDISEGKADDTSLSNGQRLKILVSQYGPITMVFHVSMSLTSLGLMYVAVGAGLPVVDIAAKVGVDLSGSVASSASTFAVAYVVHKMLAPGRIAITLVAVPYIVRQLRALGYMRKVPAAQQSAKAGAAAATGKKPQQ